jgi:hypothetical protein
MSSATFDKHVVLLGPGLTFQDNRMRNSLSAEERLAVTLKLQKKPFALFFIHISFMVVLSGKDKKIQNIHYSLQFCL